MRKGLRHLPWLTFAFASLICLSCSLFGTRSSLSLKLDPSLIGTRAPSRTAYDCYLVSVTGPGISPVVAGNDIGSYAPDCLAPGVSSKMLAGTALQESGVKLTIPAGAKRRVAVFGVVTSIHSACENADLSKLFENEKKPELYELAAREADIFKDTRINFVASDVNSSPSNLLNQCFAAPPPTYDPNNLSAVQIVTRSTETGKYLQNFQLDAAGVLTFIESVDLVGFPNQAVPNRDLSRVLYWNAAISGSVRQFAIGLPGLLVDEGTPGSVGEFYENEKLAYSDDNKYVYVAASGQRHLKQLKYDPDLKTNGPTIDMSDSFENYWVWGNTLHWINNSASAILTYSATMPDNFAFSSTPSGSLSGISIPSAVLERALLRGTTGVYLAYNFPISGTYELSYFARTGNSLAKSGDSWPINENGGYGNIRLALDPVGNYLFTKFQFSGGELIASYKLDSSGKIVSKSNLNLLVTGFVDFAVDHRGKYLVLGSQSSGSVLSTCRIQDTGDLDTCVEYPSTIATGLTALQSFPVR